MISYVQRFCHSIFTRLALVILLAAILLNILTYHLFFGFQNGNDTALNRHIMHYTQYLVHELGSPPDINIAQRLGEDLHMRITSETANSPSATPDINWSVGKIAPFPSNKLHTWYQTDVLQAASLHGWHRIQIHTPTDGTLVFDIYPTDAERAQLHTFGLLFLAGTCMILLITYGIIRFMLRPVRWLTEGAAAVRDGALHHRVPEKSTGELRDLVRTFNEMVTRLNSLVQSQQSLLLAVSHELRTPLTRLKLRIELIKHDMVRTGSTTGETMPANAGSIHSANSAHSTSPRRLSDVAAAMGEDVREMEAMITVLLDAARMRHEATALHRTQTDLCQLLTEVVSRFADRMPGVRLTLPTVSVIAEIDSMRITALASNLLDNALKYSEPNCSPVEIRLTTAPAGTTLIVQDFGIGIPEQAIPHLFEPFFRVDESRTRDTGGFGLGLNLCQAIVQAHGGTIALSSMVGQGTTVTVHLPKTAVSGA